MKDVAEGLAAHGVGGEAEQRSGGGVGKNDFSAGVGDQDGFGEGAQRGGGEGGGERVIVGRGGGREVGGQGDGEADDPREVAFAGEAAVRAEEHGHGVAVLAAEADSFREGAVAGSAGEQPSFESTGRRFGRECGGEGYGLGGELALLVAEEFFPGWGEPENLAGEIEFEGGERSAAAEVLEPGLVGEGFLLELFTIGDVEMDTDDAGEFAGCGDHLKTAALDPNPMATPMLHAKLDVEGAGADGGLFADFVGCRGGVFGVDELMPSRERVGQFGVGVAHDFFPRRGKEHPVDREVKVEKARGALVGEQCEARSGVVQIRGDDGWRRESLGVTTSGGLTQVSWHPAMRRSAWRGNRCRPDGR